MEIQRKIAHLHVIQEDSEGDSEEVQVIGDVFQEPFRINWGTNDSTRITNPHAPERVAEILEKIKIGKDLTEKQKEGVKELVSKYADIFALTMSKVMYINWHRHHLNVNPGAKLPK